MNRKLIGILIILSGLFALGGIAYFMFIAPYLAGRAVDPPSAAVNTGTQDIPLKNVVIPVNTNNAQEIEDIKNKAVIDVVEEEPNDPGDVIKAGQETLTRLSTSFVERFGTYSNYSNFNNITELKIFMSIKMRRWGDNFIKEQAGQYNDIYYGITTKAISSEILDYDDNFGNAEIMIKTLRRESTGSTNNASTFYQDIILSMTKERGAWKVDSVTWQ